MAKFCKNCGAELNENQKVCLKCGAMVDDEVKPAEVDSGSVSWGFLGFFIPIVGIILYFVWKSSKPRSAKQAGRGALVSICISIFSSILYAILTATVLVGSAGGF